MTISTLSSSGPAAKRSLPGAGANHGAFRTSTRERVMDLGAGHLRTEIQWQDDGEPAAGAGPNSQGQALHCEGARQWALQEPWRHEHGAEHRGWQTTTSCRNTGVVGTMGAGDAQPIYERGCAAPG